MSSAESTSMASIVSSLCSSFQQVPPAAISPLLDCILASTSSSASALFFSLLDSFPPLSEDAFKEGEKLGVDQCKYIASMVGALCHLLKKLEGNHNAFQSYIWKVFIPSMRREMINQIVESFLDAVTESNSWGVLEKTLMPFILSSVGLSLGMLKNPESDVREWGRCSSVQVSNEQIDVLDIDKEYALSLSRSFSLSTSCHILTFIMDAALQSLLAASRSKLLLENGHYVEKFSGSVLWDLCNLTERLLLLSLEHRSCAIGFLLPIILKVFVSHHSLEVSVDGQTLILSRNNFLKKIWNCCRNLFLLGPLERRDAYNILSLYLSSFSCSEVAETADRSVEAEELDLTSEKEFWVEIKRGLVDEEGFVRKQSLHILKTILWINGERHCGKGVSEKKLQETRAVPPGMTKRERWAAKEATSLGVEKFRDSIEVKEQQHWQAFILLYEMLDEYGTHLVEAAWNHQVSLLLQFCASNDNLPSTSSGVHQTEMKIWGEVFEWLSILWVQGLRHGNPQVRCLIMQSFLGIQCKDFGNCETLVPESFVLGPFMEGLNDPVHHKDFGVKGVYTSKTVEGASCFLRMYTSFLTKRKRIPFFIHLALVAKQQSFGRVGLMALAECIASAASGVGLHSDSETTEKVQIESSPENILQTDTSELLDALRFVIESSKQHFNPKYRLRVCGKVLEAAASLVCPTSVPFETLLHFISAVPREFTDSGGSLRGTVQEWLLRCGKLHFSNCCGTQRVLLKRLHDFPKCYTRNLCLDDGSFTYDDEDLDSWEFEAKRWARMFFLVVKEANHVAPVLKFIQNHGASICKDNTCSEWVPVKFLILCLSFLLEIEKLQQRSAALGSVERMHLLCVDDFIIYKELAKIFISILEELVSFGNTSCSFFWSCAWTEDSSLPNSVRGKLGGPSQRRLSSSTTTAVLQAIMSVKAVALISSWCAQFQTDASLNFAYTFLWNFFQKTITSPTCDSEVGAEICLATYEASVSVLRSLVSSKALDFIRENDEFMISVEEGRPWLDSCIQFFLQNINTLLAVGVLARTRRSVLLNWKWLCLEHLLLLPYHALENGKNISSFISDAMVRSIFSDIVESLENAGEGSILPMLRSVRLILELFASGMLGAAVSSFNTVDSQIMWHLVHSSWILHVSCNKRRIAPIAALLSSVLHSSLFGDEGMHVMGDTPGPLKWFIDNLLEEGTKSPRTIRLAALHLTGLWLLNPWIIKYYIKELRLLTLYGSVAFDEDFEAELIDNPDAKTEVSLLAKGPNSELTEAFINTELFARVSVAVLFYKLADLADMVGSADADGNCQPALDAGKLFLLELLDFVVNDKDMAKELYKKYSGVHRRKIRAWQMICVLSRFVDHEIVGKVTSLLHLSLYRNNLPAVRQYLETFAINIYLKFPSLVREQLFPILQDYDTRPQALSSYVFIAANVILHAPREVQSKHLDVLFPPIVPLLTSHHHSLRGFTQLLVFHVLNKLFPTMESMNSKTMPVEKRCFEELKSYLAKNSDCARLRASMEGYLDAYDPKLSVTPAGIFINRVEELEFECVPTSLMDQVLNFLNDAREELRCSMAKDNVTIKNEKLEIDEDPNSIEISDLDKGKSHTHLTKDFSLDFQKKITLSKHERKDTSFSSVFGDREPYKQLLELEEEDVLFDQVLQSRSLAMERLRASRQQFVLVASFIDRIPNLAGLARTCEVFKASGLAVADADVVRDKQFQLISVTAEKWVPMIEVPINSVKHFLERKKHEGYSILGLEQTANSIPLDQYSFPEKTVLVLGREKEGIPVDIIHILDACIEIPQLGVVRSLNVHVSGAIALWEYTRQHRLQ